MNSSLSRKLKSIIIILLVIGTISIVLAIISFIFQPQIMDFLNPYSMTGGFGVSIPMLSSFNFFFAIISFLMPVISVIILIYGIVSIIDVIGLMKTQKWAYHVAKVISCFAVLILVGFVVLYILYKEEVKMEFN